MVKSSDININGVPNEERKYKEDTPLEDKIAKFSKIMIDIKPQS